MNFFKELWRYKLVSSLVIAVIILIILSIIFPIILLQNLTTQLSIITALSMPFIMKGFERKKKDKDEKDIVVQIIKRVKDYLNYILNHKEYSRYHGFSTSMPFLRFISQKFPEILIKIGIEIKLREEENSIYERTLITRSTELFILDRYFLQLHPTCRLMIIEEKKDVTPDKKKFEEILGKLVDHINGAFSFKIDKKLAKF
ncbi:hypothetical protein LCGC14_1164550 [marine sediment metagenome]|uniref:Uncharacterized protein n=1 Tax=marine sediment metagenome TaxID=412755 RepID=A0A0F9LRR7_9ZZZZ|nr:MAG: hypothetical protein Lokiarch_16910 [Candidatus Lokiarchaeum sp. GC14_75]